MKKLILLFGAVVCWTSLSAQLQYTFTTAGATGQFGPTQSDINTAYTGTSLAGQVTSNAGMQYWVVPQSGYYRIHSLGAQGGGVSGGKGASITGEFSLLAGDTLFIIVGQEGLDGTDGSASAGGGSFVAIKDVTSSNITSTGKKVTPLVIAGGGGGNPGIANADCDGSAATSGKDGSGVDGSGIGGINGNGGGIAVPNGNNRAGGGGGFLTDGDLTGTCGTGGAESGLSFLNGGIGGLAVSCSTPYPGGFGGGGGATSSGWRGSGGGGGYSGGAGGQTNTVATTHRGGGGGSFNSGNNALNLAGVQLGDGQVVITPLSSGMSDDIGTISIDAPNNFCAGSRSVLATIQNYGTNVVTSATVNWSVNGVVQTPFSFTGLLDTIGGSGSVSGQVTLGNYNFLAAIPYTITVWTSLPNGVADNVSSNDSLSSVRQSGLIAPTGLSSANITGTTADISWNTLGGAGYVIEWGPAGFTQGTGATATGVGLTRTITGLTPLTDYDVYLADSCGANDVGVFAGPITFTTGCAGPVSGVYTLNPGLPYSSTNFVSFAQLALAFDICGISGPVTVNVAPGMSFYEQIVFGPVSGSSATNTITINGNGSTLSYLSTNTNERSTMTLKGTDHMIIDSLNIKALGAATGEYGMTLRLTDDADYNIIRNCILTGDTASTSSLFANFAINGSGSNTTATSTSGPSGDYNLIEGNTIIGGYYGLVSTGQSTDSANGNILRNNVVRDYRYYGMYMYYNKGMTVEGNDVSRPFRTNLTTSYGMYIYGFNSGSIIGNKVHDPFGNDPTYNSSAYGMYMSQLIGSASARTLVANNMIYNFNSGGTIYGFYPSGLSYTDFVHNTLVINDPSSTATGVTRAAYVLGSIDNSNIQNNLFYLNRGGTGTKHLIYMGGTLSSNSKLDNNSYYEDPSMTSYEFGYMGAGISTFNQWKAATSQDSNSFDINPFLVDVVNGDYTPQSAVLDGLGGTNFSSLVSTDITGATRGTPSDPGALEFMGVPCTGPQGLTTGTVTSSSATITWSTNTTPFTIEWGPVGFKQASLTGTIVNVPTGVSSAALTGMTSNTCYDYYITQNCTSTIPGAPPVIGPIQVCTDCATAGLTGTYTIGGAAGPNNFATLDSAVSVLNSCGILAPVVFNMQGGVHNAVTITNVSGASAINTITFNGSANMGDSIIATSQSAAVEFDGARHITFNDVYMENTGGNFVVWMHAGAENINILDCDLIGSRTATGSATAVVAAANLSTSATGSGDNVNGFTISDCKIVGNYYGVSLNGSSTTSKISGLNILDNDFEDQYYYGVRTYYTDTVVISGNSIPSFRNSTNSYGLYCYYTDNATVTENEVYGAGYSAFMFGYSNYSNATPGSYSLVANNMLQSNGTYGMYFYYPNNVDMFHNTIQGGTTYGLYLNGLTTSATQDVDIRNNIIVNDGSGTALYIATEPTNTTIDYNLYYSGGNIANGVATLAAWQAADLSKNVNSVSGNPQLVGINNFHVLGGLANDAGDNTVGISRDVDGDIRPASGSTTVDIGADEYTPVTHDIALINGEFSKKSKCLNTTDTIVLDIQNVIGVTKNFGTSSLTATWDVTGPINSNGTITVNSGTLAPLDTLRLIGTPVDLSTPGVYTLNAYISPSTENLMGVNDTLESVSFTVYDDWDVQPDSVIVISNMIDTVVLEAKSPYLSGGTFFISEVCHYKTTNGAPVGGWGTSGPFPWLVADDYLEITGVPGSDLDGITLEQWDASSMLSTYTFGPGTILGPNGTAIIAIGQLTGSTPSPSNFYYHGTGTFTGLFSSGGNNGRILKDGSGNIIDAVGVGSTYSFPATSGVTAADWSGFGGSHSGMSGLHLTGPDLNNASNWVLSTVTAQDPNIVNAGVSVPAAASTAGFDWKLNGVVIDTMPQTVVGPYTSGGVFHYVATFNGPCGLQSDTVTVIVNLPGSCPIPTNITGSAPACDSLIFNWNSAADSSIVAYVLTGGTMPAGTMIVGDSSYTVTGVTANTDYDFYVANICKGDTGVFAGPYTLNSGSAGAPVATFTPTQALGGFTVNFDASATNGNGNTYTWDFGDGSPAGSGAMTSYTYTTGGNYSVKLTVTNACGSSDTTIALNGVSMGENILSQNLRLFPNPAKNTLHIELDIAGTSDITVRILDMSGKQVMNSVNDKTGERFEGNLNISELAQGVYMIEVTDGKYTAVRRLIKE